MWHYIKWLGIGLLLSGCAIMGYQSFTSRFGPAVAEPRVVSSILPGRVDFWQDVKPILDNRCVVCHGCYDAPCQLKLSAIEGIERGASKEQVYNSSRLRPASLSRLFEDAQTLPEWRENGFFPVLNEYGNSVEANRIASPLYQLIELKEQYPLPTGKILPPEFTLGIERGSICPKPEEVENYKAKVPLWGMPYALPGLTKTESEVLKNWIVQGAEYQARPELPKEFAPEIAKWETFFNQDSLKAQLVNRYMFEHLFLAHLYFPEIDTGTFFKLVRSATPPGVPVATIATRRPYDDPGVTRVYYRLLPVLETIVAKSHLPYALDSNRMARWQNLFYAADYTVTELPGYTAKEAANPFKSFVQLPVIARYKFMLDEAQFTIMNYIKGPVCRGSVALNVIRDHFWVFFVNPDLEKEISMTELLKENSNLLELPNKAGSTYAPLSNWLKYSEKEKAFLALKDQFLTEQFTNEQRLFNLDLLWDGGGHNQNAALTVFRHYDSATVQKGMIGDPPLTAWVIGYSLLERIHYLLVAGYDVYGNVGHQLLSRLHMDFLRMEGENNFLLLLPLETRIKERENWYRDAESHVKDYLTNPSFEKNVEPDIAYKTAKPKQELFTLIQNRLGAALAKEHAIANLANASLVTELKRLSQFSGVYTGFLAESSVIEITSDNNQASEFITLMLNRAHLNITSLLKEEKLLIPEENTVTVAYGIIGSYPNVYFRVKDDQITDFVNQVLALKSAADYTQLLDNYGVRRTDPNFWQHSDKVHRVYKQFDPIQYGLLDYNRLENR